MKNIGILVIHGIGTEGEDYDVPFKNALFEQLKKAGKDPDQIAYGKVYWADFLNTRQKNYFQECLQNARVRFGWKKVRHEVIDRLADASAYQWKAGQSNKNYFNIIRRIHACVRGIHKELDSDEKPLLIFAHSLGCFIINNYIWDAHKFHAGRTMDWPKDIHPEGRFEQMVNLAGVITFGCNIPMFVLGYDPIEAIQFPHNDLSVQLSPKVAWYNYYDPIDILGWPLRLLPYSYEGALKPPGKYSYQDVVTEDIPVKVRGWKFWRWVFLSAHTGYWTHHNFLKPAAEFVSKFM